jgi:hypothetical protein
MSKYKAHPLYYHPSSQQVIAVNEAKELDKSNLIHFPSRHEFAVYKTLLSLTDRYQLKIHDGIEVIKPGIISTYPKGKKWLADFTLSNADLSLQMIVEAKGKITKDFPLILALLELNNKELLDKLWLVFPSQVPVNNQAVNNLRKTSMRQRIVTLTEFKTKIYSEIPITQLL